MSDYTGRTREYWKKNVQYLIILLSLWAFASFGMSIILADILDTVQIAGFKLGFWFAQQGSIISFLIIIAVYVYLMNRLDRDYDVHER